MNSMDWLMNRDKIEKDNYERMKAFDVYENRWPKWIKYTKGALWIVMVVVGFILADAFGAMIGFILGGTCSILYEKVCRFFVGKKLGIKDVSYDDAVRDIVERQNREYREEEQRMIAENNARIEAEQAAKMKAEEEENQ